MLEERTGLRDFIKSNGRGVLQNSLNSKEGFRFEDEKLIQIKNKIESRCIKLSDLGLYNLGIQTSCNEAFIIDKAKYEGVSWNDLELSFIHPCVMGRHINKNSINSDTYLIVIPCGWTEENRGNEEPLIFMQKVAPNIMNHFEEVGSYLGDNLYNRSNKGDYWWELRKYNYDIFNSRNVVWSRISKTAKFAMTDKGQYCINSVSIIVGDSLDYLVPLLNSFVSELLVKTLYSIDIVGGIVYAGGRAIMNTRIPKLDDKQKKELLTNFSEKLVQDLYGLDDSDIDYLKSLVSDK